MHICRKSHHCTITTEHIQPFALCDYVLLRVVLSASLPGVSSCFPFTSLHFLFSFLHLSYFSPSPPFPSHCCPFPVVFFPLSVSFSYLLCLFSSPSFPISLSLLTHPFFSISHLFYLFVSFPISFRITVAVNIANCWLCSSFVMLKVKCVLVCNAKICRSCIAVVVSYVCKILSVSSCLLVMFLCLL